MLRTQTCFLYSIVAWGAVLACTAACNNFTGLVIVRTLLGIFECVCQPTFVFLYDYPFSFLFFYIYIDQNSSFRLAHSSTMWYTREEQGLAIGAFYACNGFQQMVGGLIAYGVAQIQHAAIKNWQILFLV